MERLPGFRDFYPEPVPHQDLWSAEARTYIFEKWRAMARAYGFHEYDGPPMETLDLFTTKSGEEIVGQLYNFTDKGGREVSLRPEMTPTLARMVAAHERSYKKPIKWFTLPQLFRYERQQKGRLREHFQFNADIVGDTSPAADAELIALLIDTLRSFKLGTSDILLRVSSRSAWKDFFSARSGKPEDEYAFYQAIDKLEREEPAVSEQKLTDMGFGLSEVQSFIQASVPTPELQAILENLRNRGLAEFVKIDYGIIRGLAYYTGVVFEAFDARGEFRAIAGGGRYDNLISLISGGKVNLPSLGFGMGDVVLLELLKSRKLLPNLATRLDVFCVIDDETLRGETLGLVQELRWAGLATDYSLGPLKPEKQYKRAQELGSRSVVRLERGADGNVVGRLRDLASRAESLVSRNQLLDQLKAGLS